MVLRFKWNLYANLVRATIYYYLCLVNFLVFFATTGSESV